VSEPRCTRLEAGVRMRSNALRVGAAGMLIAEGSRKSAGRLLPGVLEVVTVEGGRRQGGTSAA
jgi:hypothetical protein